MVGEVIHLESIVMTDKVRISCDTIQHNAIFPQYVSFELNTYFVIIRHYKRAQFFDYLFSRNSYQLVFWNFGIW